MHIAVPTDMYCAVNASFYKSSLPHHQSGCVYLTLTLGLNLAGLAA